MDCECTLYTSLLSNLSHLGLLSPIPPRSRDLQPVPHQVEYRLRGVAPRSRRELSKKAAAVANEEMSLEYTLLAECFFEGFSFSAEGLACFG